MANIDLKQSIKKISEQMIPPKGTRVTPNIDFELPLNTQILKEIYNNTKPNTIKDIIISSIGCIIGGFIVLLIQYLMKL